MICSPNLTQSSFKIRYDIIIMCTRMIGFVPAVTVKDVLYCV